jgi:hypothetical protein
MAYQYLYVHKPHAIFSALVNQGSFTYPIQEVAWDGLIGGGYAAIKPGMTVVFGTTAGGDDLGRGRIRKAATADTIYFGRSSQGVRDGECDLADNVYIYVRDEYRLWAKIPYIEDDGTIYKDGDLEVGTYTDEIPPKANIVPPAYAATIGGSDIITADFSGTASFSVVGATISTYLWDVGDGTITVGTSASSAITATFPAGFRYISLTVTDSNGETHTMRTPVYARDPASDTTVDSWNILNHRITPFGQELEIEALSDVSDTPDGTTVMLWEGEPTSSADYSHMLFWGWHHVDPTNTAADRAGTYSRTTLLCLDTAGKLATLPGFPVSVEGNASPDTWYEMSSPNMDKYLDYLLRWHSTAFEVTTWTSSGTGSAFPFVILSSDGDSLFDQVERRARALVPDYHFTCNRMGQLAVIIDPMLQDTGDRTATVQAAVNESNWSSINFTHRRAPEVHWHRGNAIRANATEISALFCVAPGEAPGQGVFEQEQGEQLAESQTTLNACEGHRYARRNAVQTLFEIVLTGGNDRGIDPAELTWVSLTVTSDTAAQRGLTFDAERGLVHELNIAYEPVLGGLVRTVTILWERETSGTPAVTYIPPDRRRHRPGTRPTQCPILARRLVGVGLRYGLCYDQLARTVFHPRLFCIITRLYGGLRFDRQLVGFHP